MNIENPKWMDESKQCVSVSINGVQSAVPNDPANKDYQAVIAWAEVDGNVIADAD
jgi:hypothetical protein